MTVRIVVQRDQGTWSGSAEIGGAVVYAHGRTLPEVQRCAADALELLPGHRAPVEVVPWSPELEALEGARARYEDALTAAVRQLRENRATWADAARASGVSQRQARAVLATPRDGEE